MRGRRSDYFRNESGTRFEFRRKGPWLSGTGWWEFGADGAGLCTADSPLGNSVRVGPVAQETGISAYATQSDRADCSQVAIGIGLAGL